MLSSIQLTGYRAFSRLKLDGLRRVTLIVGKNNTGKTSILEAAEILAIGGSMGSLARSMERRGERFPESENERGVPELDISHLFHGHTTEVGSQFSIIGTNGTSVGLHGLIINSSQPGENPNDSNEQPSFELEQDNDALELIPPWDELIDLSPPRSFQVSNTSNGRSTAFELSAQGGLRLPVETRRSFSEPQRSGSAVLLIPTDGMPTRTLGSLWNSIALTADEDAVIDALRIIEPSIERLAYLQTGSNPTYYLRRAAEGFFANLAGVQSRVPFGSMGDGMKRLLALAMAVNRASGGFLLVDEIDTGLHYSTMPGMWKLIVQTAQRLNVQVIATTHSGDCVRSLAWLHENAPELAVDVALHRIERDAYESVPFSAEELSIGSQQHMEFR